jgi:uncharacterized protein (DUF934 family)
MARLIKDGAVREDGWVHLADDAPPPAEGDVIVPLARWRREREALARRNGGIGVRLGPADPAAAIAGDLARLAVVALEFGTFKDGRAFSQAALLRRRYRYAGEIRAVGDVQRDQIFFMRRCGIDAFELRSDRSAEDALAAFREFSVTYQAAPDDPRPLYRRAARGAAPVKPNGSAT